MRAPVFNRDRHDPSIVAVVNSEDHQLYSAFKPDGTVAFERFDRYGVHRFALGMGIRTGMGVEDIMNFLNAHYTWTRTLDYEGFQIAVEQRKALVSDVANGYYVELARDLGVTPEAVFHAFQLLEKLNVPFGNEYEREEQVVLAINWAPKLT